MARLTVLLGFNNLERPRNKERLEAKWNPRPPRRHPASPFASNEIDTKSLYNLLKPGLLCRTKLKCLTPSL